MKQKTIKQRMVFIKPLMNTIVLNELPKSVIDKFKRSPRKLFFLGVVDIFNVIYIINRMIIFMKIREEEIKTYTETVISAIVQDIVRISAVQEITSKLTPFDIEFMADLQLDYKSLK